MAEPLPPKGVPFLVEDCRLSNAIHHRVEAASRLAASEPQLANLPFPQLARWSPGERAALEVPLDPIADRAWVLSLPKVELHCHLGGFGTHGEPLAQVRSAALHPENLPPAMDCAPPSGWPETTLPQQPKERLNAYMRLGDNSGSALLTDPSCLVRHCQLLYDHLLSQRVVHAEIRCSPANYATKGRSPWTVLSDVKAAFDACMAARPGCHVNLIIIATRKDGGDFRTAIGRHLTLAVTAAEHWMDDPACQIVGVDLAGFEDVSTRAHYFREDFRAVHRCGLALTVHAGENDDAEGIWSAVFDLNARRVGHALSLGESPDLLRSVADRRIGIEMCPFANLQIKGFPLGHEAMDSPAAYPLLKYLAAGVPVTVNTDNIGISAAGLSENILLLARLCPGITRLHVLELLRNGIDQAFASTSSKVALRSNFIPPIVRS
jgi:adenosine deaminase